MNHDNISILVSRICVKKLLFRHNDEDYVLYSPDSEVRYLSDLYYEETKEDNKYEEWILQENLDNVLRFLGIWDNNREDQLKTAEKQIEQLKVDLFLERLKTASVKSIKQKLKQKKDFYEELMNIKTSMDYLTLENFCNSRKNEFIIINTLRYRQNNKLVFDSMDDIDYKTFQNITNIIASNFISIETYKKIAKSDIWRNIWNSNKNNIFNGPACDFSEEQKTLIGLSNMYDRVYEHPESPDQSVIDDDDMLDGWMIYQKRKTEENNKEKNATSLTNKHKKANEIFVVAGKEDAKEIRQLNSGDSLRKIQQRANVISKNKEVNEFDLPDVQQSIKLRENTKIKK